MLRRSYRFTATVTLALAVSLLVAGTSGARTDEKAAPSAAGPQIVVGAALPLTGPFAGFGATWINGVRLAYTQINRSGGINGKKIKLYVEDWASDTAKAVQVFQKLAEVNKAQVVLGGGSGAILAQAAVANRTQTVLLNAAAQTPAMRQSGPYVFSNINDANKEADDLMRFAARKLGIKRAVITWVDNATGQGGRDGLQAAAKKYDVEIIESVSHSFTDFNYRTVIARIKDKNPPAVLVASHREHTGQLLKQAAEAGLKTTWLGLSPTVGDDTIQIAGNAAIEGFHTIRSQFDVTQNQPKVKAFVTAYRNAFKSEPDIYAAHFYDAMFLIKDAAEKRGAKDGPSFAKAFESYNGHGDRNRFFGVSGPTAFDADGMVRKANFIMQVKSGKLVLEKAK